MWKGKPKFNQNEQDRVFFESANPAYVMKKKEMEAPNYLLKYFGQIEAFFPDNPEKQAYHNEILQILKDIMADNSIISAADAHFIQLYFIENKNITEIAKMLNIKRYTAKTRLKSILLKLKTAFSIRLKTEHVNPDVLEI